MDRQTLDMEGARQGEVSAASLQLGDDTIAIARIATMTVEEHSFTPWDTPRNRQTQSFYATCAIGAAFFGLAGIAAWMTVFKRIEPLLIGCVLLLVACALGIRAAQLAMKLRKAEPYYRLVIGSSDGRQIPLVDNNRGVLEKIRDVVRHKMDSGDRNVTGEFDLNLDIFRFTPIPSRMKPEPVDPPSPASVPDGPAPRAS